MNLYLRSVGRNAKLLLNVPPTREGVLHDTDVSCLMQFAERRRAAFAVDVARGRKLAWRWTGPNAMTGEIDLGRDATIGHIRLEEDITKGQVVSRYIVSALGVLDSWREIARGTTIGYARIDAVAPVRTRRLRILIESIGAPIHVALRAYENA